MRCSMARVAVDCAPVAPSISGSITSRILPAGTLALEKRSLAAFRSACSKTVGVGGGAAGRVCANAEVDDSATPPTSMKARKDRPRDVLAGAASVWAISVLLRLPGEEASLPIQPFTSAGAAGAMFPTKQLGGRNSPDQ